MARLIDITGKAISGEWGTDDLDGSGIPVLRTTNFTNTGEVSYANVVTRSITKKNISNKFLRKGDIIIEKSGGSDKQPVGRVIYFEGEENKYLFNNFTGLLRVVNSQKWYSKYVFYSLYAYYQKGGTRAFENKTTGLHNLKLENYLNAVEVRNLSLEIQVQRSFELDKLRKIITLRRTQLAKLDELVKCRFVEMFGDKKTNPHKWPTARIGACCTLKSGTSLPAEKENEGGPIPYVKVGDMNYLGNEHYITTSSRFVSEHTAGAGIFPIGTVIFPKRGGAIGTNKKRLTSLPICADLNVMGVTAGAKLEPLYLFAYFNSIDLGALGGGGSSIPQINNKDIAPLIICLPPMALQKQFTAFVRRVDKLRFTVQASLDKTQQLFDSLMQEYFG